MKTEDDANFSWDGILHPRTRMFLNSSLENEYTVFTNTPRFLRRLHYLSSLSTKIYSVWGLRGILGWVLWSEKSVGSVVTTCGFLLAAIVWGLTQYFISHNPRWFLARKLENITGLLLAFTGVLGCFIADTYSNPHDTFLEDQTRQTQLLEAWIRFSLLLSWVPFFILLAGIGVGVLRFHTWKRVFGTIILVHAIRCLVITPLPPGSVLIWVLVFYIFMPVIFWTLVRVHETQKRETFLLHSRLSSENASLLRELKAAKEAGVPMFEQTTYEEKDVVSKAVLSRETLSGIEIPFSLLELQARIGAGAFGEVIKATYAGTSVAVKRMLRSRINEDSVRMMVTEVTLLRNLRHPNIVQLVGASWDSAANLCIVLELVDRGSLGAVLQDASITLTWGDPKLKMLSDIVAGIFYLHSQPSPVIHRDLKPDNVLVTATFGCKLTDFGVSRKLSPDLTMTQEVGTFLYMAPEVLRGERYDEQVDIYALGIILVVMHTGRRPVFQGMGNAPGAAMVVALLRGLRPVLPWDMPKPLRSLAQICWREDPEERPSAADLVAELKDMELHSSTHSTSIMVVPAE